MVTVSRDRGNLLAFSLAVLGLPFAPTARSLPLASQHLAPETIAPHYEATSGLRPFHRRLEDGSDEPPFELNSDFDMGAALMEPLRLTNGVRLRTMLRVLFHRTTPQIIENKLLIAALLYRAGLPVPQILHGSFYETPLGPFPLYSPSMLRARVQKLTMRGDFDWVVKPATGALGKGVLPMSNAKWRRESYTPPKVVDFVNTWFELPSIKRLEHRGVLLQRRFDMSHRELGDSEYKVHVIFGKPVEQEAWAQPSQYKMVLLRNPAARIDGKSACVPPTEPLCQVYTSMFFGRHWALVKQIARKVAVLFGLPWFRLDLFIGDGGSRVQINEVTFPSHALVTWQVLDILQAAFRPRPDGSLPYRVVNSTVFNQRLLDGIGCKLSDFLTSERCAQTKDGSRACASWDMPAWNKWVEQHINETLVRYQPSDAIEWASRDGLRNRLATTQTEAAR